MTLVGKWNDYTTSMIYIRDENLYTLQYLLQRLMDEAGIFENSFSDGHGKRYPGEPASMPSESLKFALCVVAAGPMLVVFPLLPEVFFAGPDHRSGKGVTALTDGKERHIPAADRLPDGRRTGKKVAARYGLLMG